MLRGLLRATACYCAHMLAEKISKRSYVCQYAVCICTVLHEQLASLHVDINMRGMLLRHATAYCCAYMLTDKISKRSYVCQHDVWICAVFVLYLGLIFLYIIFVFAKANFKFYSSNFYFQLDNEIFLECYIWFINLIVISQIHFV